MIKENTGNNENMINNETLTCISKADYTLLLTKVVKKRVTITGYV